MVEILILYILSKYDATIYKIRKLIEERFFMFSTPSLGAINPALKKLEGLSCVEFESKMSDGGMLSKTYKITPFGIKYFKSLVVSYEFKNKAHILNNVSILACISDILDEGDKKQLHKNCLNNILILKKDMEEAISNPYNMYDTTQKRIISTQIASINSLVEIFQ